MQGLPIEIAVRYVAAAYIGLWLAVLVYVVMISNAMGKLRRDIALLTETVQKRSQA